jgi:uncharacterized membrane protein
MNKNLALKIVLAISVVGMLFSGYLTYGELVQQSCTAGGCSALLGIPVCVYGFVMYAVIFAFTVIGLKSKK